MKGTSDTDFFDCELLFFQSDKSCEVPPVELKYGGALEMLSRYIKELVNYGINSGLTPECERIYTTNLLLREMHEDSYDDSVEIF